MADRPASWRMPTIKQMEKMAAGVGRKVPPGRALAPNEDLPPEYWQAVLEDPRPKAVSVGPGPSGRLLQLGQIPQHFLRVGCRRCGRTIEIQKADATRLYVPVPAADQGVRCAGSAAVQLHLVSRRMLLSRVTRINIIRRFLFPPGRHLRRAFFSRHARRVLDEPDDGEFALASA
jgi:hypothetical protein